MAARLLTIEPFELPDGSNPEVEITISLVDSDNRRLQGLTTQDGQPVVDRTTLLVHQENRTVSLWPQPELVPILEHDSSADQSTTYYLVDIINRRTRYRQQIRTQIDSGGSLSWSEFVNGQGPLEGGQLPGWMTHIENSGIHVPSGGLTGQALTKQSDADGDTHWVTGSGGGSGEANVGVNVGLGTDIYRDKTGVGLNFHRIADTPTVDASLANDTISLNVPAGQFDVFGAAATVQASLDIHTGNLNNPHATTKIHVGLSNVDNTSDVDKPVSIAQQSALDLKADDAALTIHIGDGTLHVPPGGVANQVLAKIDAVDGNTEWQDPLEGSTDEKTKVSAADTTAKFLDAAVISGDASVSFSIVNPGGNEQLDIRATGAGGGESNDGANVGVGVDVFRDKSGVILNFHRLGSTATVIPALAADTISFNVPAGQFDPDGSAAAVQSNLDTHIAIVTGNPHGVTKADVGLGFADNTADIDKPISTLQQSALDLKATQADLVAHTGNTSNPHSTTKLHVGLGNVDNTSDLAKPISSATQTALNLKADDSALVAHTGDAGIHVPAGGAVDQILTKASGADGDTSWEDVPAGALDEKAKVSAADTTSKYLQAALTSGDASVTFSIINPGANEQLDVRASGVGGGESNEGANVGTGVDIYRNKSGVVLNFHRLGATSTVVPSLLLDTISFDVPTNTFDSFGAAASVQAALNAHTATVTGNPHAVTKSDVGLSVVDNTADANKPVSVLQQAALDLKADDSALNAHTGNAGIHVPAGGFQFQVLTKASASDGDTQWVDPSTGGAEANDGANVGTGVGVYRGKTGVTLDFHSFDSTPTVVPSLAADTISFNVPAGQFDPDGSAAAVQGNLDTHTADQTNPHVVTQAQVGLGNVDNTSDADKPISTLQQTALDLKLDKSGDTLTDYGEAFQTQGNISGSVVVDISQGQTVTATLTADATSFTITNPSNHAATSFSLLLVTGGFDITSWAPSIAGWFGAAPDLSSGGTHGFGFELIGGSWYGTHKGAVI